MQTSARKAAESYLDKQLYKLEMNLYVVQSQLLERFGKKNLESCI